MVLMLKPSRFLAGAVTTVALVTTGCTSPSDFVFGESPSQDSAQATASITTEPEFGPSPGTSDEVSTETITVDQQEVTVPVGIRLPDVPITYAGDAHLVMASPDKAPVVNRIKESAREAGYELYAEGSGGMVFIGHGNAVLLAAKPHVQLLMWAPEAMKDVLVD